jgi:hypothetical protein
VISPGGDGGYTSRNVTGSGGESVERERERERERVLINVQKSDREGRRYQVSNLDFRNGDPGSGKMWTELNLRQGNGNLI